MIVGPPLGSRAELEHEYRCKTTVLAAQWLQAASKNEAFDFLNDPDEDIYSLRDGKPFDQ